MSQIGHIAPFEESSEDIDTYISRVELFFIANSIKDTKQVATFLTLLGPKIFHLVQNLVSPKKPGDCTYAELVKALKDHFKPKVVIIYERYKFHTRSQQQGESISNFVAGLKSCARTCDFGEVADDMLRDRFVVGLADTATQRTLLTEMDLTFQKAVSIATAREVAEKDVREMGGSRTEIHSVKSNSNVQFKSSHFNPKGTSNSKTKTSGDSNLSPCFGCGGSHWRKDCPHKNSECFLCHKKGHLRSVCKNKWPGQANSRKSSGNSKQNHVVEVGSPRELDALESYSSFLFYSSQTAPASNAPIVVNAQFDGVGVELEVDTGAARSIISSSDFYRFWPSKKTRPTLRPCPTLLKAYGGMNLPIRGEISVSITTSNCSIQAPIIVVDGKGPCLLGRDLISALRVNVSNSSFINSLSQNKSNVVTKFPSLFSPGLGCYTGGTFSFVIDPTVTPKYCKSRPVPYALRSKVDQELDRLLAEKIIEPVSHADWAAAIVPVLKPNGSVRICGDYKLTVNRAVKIDTYPIPRLEDLFAALSGGKFFTKLDMSQAYNQLCLDDESKPYTVINTHRGLFRYNRLCFGVSSAPGIFQRAMEQLLRGLPGVLCYLDDILICGSSAEEHSSRLRKVLSILQDKGLKLHPDKCVFGVSEVCYLGYVINASGIHPDTNKVKAIADAPRPSSVKQLQAFLGSLGFYRRFIPQASKVLEPLNRLLCKDVKWHWSSEQESAFVEAKRLLLNSKALVHFDPDLPLTVIADSSSYGVGAVLCHNRDGFDHPISFASRTLTSAEKNYSQLEKEALAIIFALKKFHDYLWGRHFTVITDHRPLLGIFSPEKQIPPMASGRIQRWALLLQAYSFTLRHRSGAFLGTADALSRLPLPVSVDSVPVLGEWINLIHFLESSPVTAIAISQATRTDPLLSKVHRYCEIGWPAVPFGSDLFSYYSRRDELSVEHGCVLWGYRVIIPNKLRSALLSELHSGHVGASRMKELARSYLWWPGLDKDLEFLVNSCSECLEKRPMPRKAELHPWEWPNHPWHRIHVDYAGPVRGKYFLVVVDAHSKWVEVFPSNGPTANDTIKHLRHCFSTFGLPVSLVSDNGSCFTSSLFQEFLVSNGIRHITTAVYKPATNGLAERMVQTFKRSFASSTDSLEVFLDKFLFKYRITPHGTTGVSPAEMMFKRRVRHRLDLLFPADQITSRVAHKQEVQRSSRASSRVIDINPGDPVMVRNYMSGSKWLPATVDTKSGPLSYRCELPDGRIIKRHQDQIHSRQITPYSEKTAETPVSSVVPPAVQNELPFVESSPLESVEVRPCESEVPSTSGTLQSSRRSTRIRRPVEKLNL